MSTEIQFILNGNDIQMKVEDHWTLLYLLRELMGLTGTKEGCGSGECGACTVIIDGQAVNSCLYLAAEVNGRNLMTIEGLAKPDGTLHTLQRAFVEHGGIQCGNRRRGEERIPRRDQPGILRLGIRSVCGR